MLAYDPLLGLFWTILWIYIMIAWIMVLFLVIAVGQGRRRHPAPDGQILGMTPEMGQAIHESHPVQDDNHRPGS